MLLRIRGIVESILHELQEHIDSLKPRETFQLFAQLRNHRFTHIQTKHRIGITFHIHLRIAVKQRHQVGIQLAMNRQTVYTYTIMMGLIRH